MSILFLRPEPNVRKLPRANCKGLPVGELRKTVRTISTFFVDISSCKLGKMLGGVCIGHFFVDDFI